MAIDEVEASPTLRRRGKALERALLHAAWGRLVASGYSNFTLEAVADEAQTSRSVIHRRWSSRAELAIAAIAHHISENPLTAPGLGSLRADLIAVLEQSMKRGALIASIVARDMSDFYRDARATPAALREAILGAEGGLLNEIVEHAAARGELKSHCLPARLISLPADLLRHEVFMQFSPVPSSVICEIVDQIVLPLLKTYQTLDGEGAEAPPTNSRSI